MKIISLQPGKTLLISCMFMTAAQSLFFTLITSPQTLLYITTNYLCYSNLYQASFTKALLTRHSFRSWLHLSNSFYLLKQQQQFLPFYHKCRALSRTDADGLNYVISHLPLLGEVLHWITEIQGDSERKTQPK